MAEPDQEAASPLSGIPRRPTDPASPARPPSPLLAPQTDPHPSSCANNSSCESNRPPMIGDAICDVMAQNTHGASYPTSEAELSPPKQCGSRLFSPPPNGQNSPRESILCPNAAANKGGESEVEPAEGRLNSRRKRKAVFRPSHSPHGDSLNNDGDSDSQANPEDDSDEEECEVPVGGSEGEHDREHNGVRPPPRKRSNIHFPTFSALNDTLAQHPRLRHPISQKQKFQMPARGRGRPRRQTIPSPPLSHISHDDQGSAESPSGRYEEWPLENVCLKRVTEDGTTTFQLQFSWDSPTKYGHETGTRRDLPKSGSSAKHSSVTRVTFTAEEDDLLIELKRQGLSWQETHEKFTARFPGRSKGTLQVRYCTKLKDRCANTVRSL